MDKNKLLAVSFPSEQAPTVNKIVVEYTQEADSADGNSGDVQFLEISTEDAGSGIYFVLKTERWAVDNLSDLEKIFNDFKERVASIR